MDLGLTGKTVLVTGGSKGIGLACAKAFLAEGARVAIVSRAQANLDRAAAGLPGVVAIAADLTDARGGAVGRGGGGAARSARSTCWSTRPAPPGAPRRRS